MICNPLLKNSCEQVSNPQGYVSNVIQALLNIFLIVGILYFIWHFFMATYHLISSGANAKKLEDAQTEITNAFIGLIVVFSVFGVLKAAGILLGIPDLQNLRLPLPSL